MVVLLSVPLYGAGSTVVDTMVPVAPSVDKYNPGVANNSADSVAHLLRMSVVWECSTLGSWITTRCLPRKHLKETSVFLRRTPAILMWGYLHRYRAHTSGGSFLAGLESLNTLWAAWGADEVVGTVGAVVAANLIGCLPLRFC